MTARRRQRARNSQAGFTLIELMISLVLFSFAIAGILSIAVTMVTGFREQRLSIHTEAASRMSIEFIADAVRGAAPGVKNEAQIQHVSICNAGVGVTGGFLLVNSAGMPDALTIVYPAGSIVTSLRGTYTTGTTNISVTDASQLSVGDTLLISNMDQGHLATITSVNTTSGAITLASQTCTLTLAMPAGGYGPGSLVIRAERVTFYVADDTTVTPSVPTLWMDPDAEGPLTGEPLAEGIEDFQVALAVDANGNGTIDTTANGINDEWFHDVPGETLPAGVVRGVRIWMVARATSGILKGSYTRPSIADRIGATAPDTFRRRVVTSTVEIRNNELSP